MEHLNRIITKFPLPPSLGAAVLVVLSVILLLPGLGVSIVLAGNDDSLTSSIEQRDLDSDGQPDLTILRGAFVTDNDTVFVYDGANDMQAGSDWRDVTDFANDTWIFDIGNDGSAQLILQFADIEGRPTAFFFDDQDVDGQVAFEVSGKEVLINEVGPWSLKVVSDGTWFLPDGYPNQNLQIFRNGNEQIVSGIVDAEHDGVPDYEYWDVRTHSSGPIPSVSPGLWVNKGVNRPDIPDDQLFWPFLLAGPHPIVQNKFDLTPHIVVDWERAVIEGTSLGKDISGYPIETGYFVLSLSHGAPLTLNEVNYVNFENPMAYYDLAADQDGWPEMHIRLIYYGPNDPAYEFGPTAVPYNEIRYSWNQQNNPGLLWDYKIGLVGTNLVTNTIQFDGIGIQTVPYEEFPEWVVNREWGISTFVARENNTSSSSEGIYLWTPREGVNPVNPSLSKYTRAVANDSTNYITGSVDDSPIRYFNEITSGYRGELTFTHPGQPHLYFSPVDNHLHLKWAEHGIWRLDDEQIIRVSNLNNDDYIDGWSREMMPVTIDTLDESLSSGEVEIAEEAPEPEIIETLYAPGGYLVYAGDETITLVESDYEPSLFETLPPTDHDTWEAHRTLLAPYESQRRDPTDLHGWLDAFPGPRSEIAGATLSHVRITDDGFRFELALAPDARVDGPDLLGLAARPPGYYLVENHAGQFSVTPLVPAQINLEMTQPNADGLAQVTVSNSGGADLTGLTLVVETQQGDLADELLRQPIDALAGETAGALVTVPLNLPAGSPLVARLEDKTGVSVASNSPLNLIGTAVDHRAIFSITRDPILLPVLGLFAMLVALAAGLTMAQRRERATP